MMTSRVKAQDRTKPRRYSGRGLSLRIGPIVRGSMRTFCDAITMLALPPKTEIDGTQIDVRYGPKADIAALALAARAWGERRLIVAVVELTCSLYLTCNGRFAMLANVRRRGAVVRTNRYV